MKLEKIFFYGEVANHGKTRFSTDTSDATFTELSELLSALKMVEVELVNHLLSLNPDWVVRDDSYP